MAQVRPFRGVRYDMARVGTLSDVVAPPYDVIDPALQHALHDLSPYNIVRLEWGKSFPDDQPGQDRYSRAARELDAWNRAGILREDPSPALYVYHQSFTVEGVTFTRKGFLARVRLEPFGNGKIHPHEKTLGHAKTDRLNLYRATGYNFSPIFGLYPDQTSEVLRTAEAGISDRTPLEAVDHLGVVSQLWPVYDQTTHTLVEGLMSERHVFIADGHHRYETGLNYLNERLAAEGQLAEDAPARFCLMMLVGMSDPGLIILPTHRLVSGFPGLSMQTLTDVLSAEFDVQEADSASDAWDQIQADGSQELLGFGTVADGQWRIARLRSDETMDRLASEQSADWRALGVSILHVLVINHLLRRLAEREPSFEYVHLLDEVTTAVTGRTCDLAVLLPSARMEDVQSIASQGETMPPKSTYFYPKLLTGLVLNPIR